MSLCNVIAFIAGDRTINDALVKLMTASPNLLIVSNLTCVAGGKSNLLKIIQQKT